jgi:hypothetical protein
MDMRAFLIRAVHNVLIRFWQSVHYPATLTLKSTDNRTRALFSVHLVCRSRRRRFLFALCAHDFVFHAHLLSNVLKRVPHRNLGFWPFMLREMMLRHDLMAWPVMFDHVAAFMLLDA